MATPWEERWKRTSAQESETATTLNEKHYGFGSGKRPSTTFRMPSNQSSDTYSDITLFLHVTSGNSTPFGHLATRSFPAAQ